MSLEQSWKLERFAEQTTGANAEVDLVYVGKGHWAAWSMGAAGKISLAAPGQDNWPRLERLIRVLAGVGIVQARVQFSGMQPAPISNSATTKAGTGSVGGLEHHAKAVAFFDLARSPGTAIELELRSDGLWYVYACGQQGRHALKPSSGEGWGRIEGLLQVLASGGLTEAEIRFKGIPPALVVADNP